MMVLYLALMYNKHYCISFYISAYIPSLLFSHSPSSHFSLLTRIIIRPASLPSSHFHCLRTSHSWLPSCLPACLTRFCCTYQIACWPSHLPASLLPHFYSLSAWLLNCCFHRTTYVQYAFIIPVCIIHCCRVRQNLMLVSFGNFHNIVLRLSVSSDCCFFLREHFPRSDEAIG